MKITVDLFDLNTVIQAMDRATKFECGDSVFDAVRFTVEGGKLKVDAYDGPDGVHVTLEGDEVYALEDGVAYVRLYELAPVMRQITGGGNVRIEAKDREVWLHFDNLSYKFEEPLYVSEGFRDKVEKVFKKRERTVGFMVSAVKLKEELEAVKSAMTDYERGTFAGVHCEMENDVIRFVATNGRVLLVREVKANNKEKKPDGVGFIPRQFVRMLEKLSFAFPYKAHVGFDKDGGGVNIGGVVSLAWEFESAFPEWRKCESTAAVLDSIEILNAKEILRALETVDRTWGRVKDDDGGWDTKYDEKCVLATDGKGGMVITGEADIGFRNYRAIKDCWSIPVECHGGGTEPIVIHFNPNYLRAALKAVADPFSVIMEYRGENQVVKFCGTKTSALVMPLREF